jgi:hypothetical protein
MMSRRVSIDCKEGRSELDDRTWRRGPAQLLHDVDTTTPGQPASTWHRCTGLQAHVSVSLAQSPTGVKLDRSPFVPHALRGIQLARTESRIPSVKRDRNDLTRKRPGAEAPEAFQNLEYCQALTLPTIALRQMLRTTRYRISNGLIDLPE